VVIIGHHQTKTCTDCSCNTTGTTGASSECADTSGACTCATSSGYSGSKCDECVFGRYFNQPTRDCSSIGLELTNPNYGPENSLGTLDSIGENFLISLTFTVNTFPTADDSFVNILQIGNETNGDTYPYIGMLEDELVITMEYADETKRHRFGSLQLSTEYTVEIEQTVTNGQTVLVCSLNSLQLESITNVDAIYMLNPMVYLSKGPKVDATISELYLESSRASNGGK